MKSASGDLISTSFLPLLIAGVTIATVALTLYCLSNGISTVFMHLYYLPIILIAYFYHRRGVPVFTGLSLLYLVLATFFLYPSAIEIESAVLRTGMFILIGVVVAELSERLEKKKEDYRIAEEYQKSIIDNANVWLTILDTKGKILSWNRAAETVSGYRADEVLGQTGIWKRMYPDKDYRRKITGTITRIITEKNYLENFESEILTKGGNTRTMSWNTRGLVGAEGKVERYVAIGLDITERKRAEEDLKKSEEKFQSLYMHMIDGTALHKLVYNDQGVPEDYVIVEVNPAFEKQLGISRDSVIGKTSREAYGVAEPPYLEIYARVALTGEPKVFETYFPPLEKHFSISVFCPHKGSFATIFEDITERWRTEEALHLTNAMLTSQMEATIDGILVVNEAGKIISYNHRFIEIWGISPDVIASQSDERALQSVFDKLIDPEEFLARVRYLYTHREEKSQEEVQLIDTRTLDRYSAPMIGSDGRYYGRVWYFRDITERKRAEEALRTSQIQLTEAMNLAHMAHWELDVPTGIFTFNDRFYALFGTTVEREGGYQMPAEVYAKEFVHPDDMQIVSDETNKAIAATDPDFTRQIEHRIIRRDGEIRHIIVRFGITKDAEGKTIKTHGANQDITERKLAEVALRQTNKQLNLLSSITRHDILNQLMALKGYLYLSHEMIDKPKTLSEYLQKEEQAANAIEAQITFTRNYQELGVAAPEWQNVNASIEKAFTGLSMRAVHVEVDPKNPEVFADRLFEKVFYNLIDNALRYGGAGLKTIRVSSQESDARLTIICEDDGVGISEEDKKRLFTRGFGKNTGLGLFLSREILAITGITITENGIPGKGARFEINVPKGMWRMAGRGA